MVRWPNFWASKAYANTLEMMAEGGAGFFGVLWSSAIPMKHLRDFRNMERTFGLQTGEPVESRPPPLRDMGIPSQWCRCFLNEIRR